MRKFVMVRFNSSNRDIISMKQEKTYFSVRLVVSMVCSKIILDVV